MTITTNPNEIVWCSTPTYNMKINYIYKPSEF